MDFKIKLNLRNIPEEDILSDMRRVAADLAQGTITSAEYTAKGNFGVTTVLRRFKTWNSALEKAGLGAPNRQRIPNDELFENLADVWTKIGQQPYGRHLDKTHGLSKFSLGTYEDRFGSWNKSLIAFEAFIQTGDGGEALQLQKATKQKEQRARTNRKINWRLRAQVLIRDNCICRMCGATPAKDADVVLHVDHIKPWTKGGETVSDNLQTLCSVCNIGKSDQHGDG